MKLLLLLNLFVLSIRAIPGASREGLVDFAANNTYDFIIVGCGIAGLVVTMRLSESPNISVLCIEAGPLDHYEEAVQFPIDIGDEIGGIYDWKIGTIPQTQLNGAPRNLPMGRVVGGGSILNGMIWNRGSQDDYNGWASLNNPGWSWNDLLPYFKKSETYTPIFYDGCNSQPVHFEAALHGFSGPVQVSYPEYYWNQSDNWFQALNELGLPTAFDPNDGTSAGGYFLPSDIEPINQTRSDARRTYYDPYCLRPNYNMLVNSQVTQILFAGAENSSTYNMATYGISSAITSSTLHATGVEFATDAATPRQTVFARQEVILASGAIHSPQILQLSGVGPAAMLEQFNITVAQDLIGVGNNLQDHCMVHIDYAYELPGLTTPHTYQTNTSYDNASETQFVTSKTGPWAGEPSTAVAFPSLPQITNTTRDIVNAARMASRYWPSTYDSTLRNGYELQFDYITSQLLSNTTPAYEILNNNGGGLDIALMHPLSRGTVELASADPFAAPLIDPRWLVNPFDTQVLITAMQFNQRILDTSAIQQLQPSYDTVPQDASVDVLTAYLMKNILTEYHYSGTCAMMPQQLGGVVDPNLLVYGTDNVRVVDTSVFPIIPGAHLQAVAYAVAEKAADIIKGVGTTDALEVASPEATQDFITWLLHFLHL